MEELHRIHKDVPFGYWVLWVAPEAERFVTVEPSVSPSACSVPLPSSSISTPDEPALALVSTSRAPPPVERSDADTPLGVVPAFAALILSRRLESESLAATVTARPPSES